MLKPVFVIGALLMVAGCRTPGPAARAATASPGGVAGTSWVVEQIDGSEVQQGTRPPAAVAGGLLRMRLYDCDGGLSFAVASPVDADAVDVALPDGRRRLPQAPSASGARYTDGHVTFWSKGAEALLARDGRTWRCTLNRYQSILENARQRGVVFRATGNEPSWLLEILDDRIVFAPGLDGERVATPQPRVNVNMVTGERVYSGTTGAHQLSVRVSPGGCVDSMSGQQFDHSVVVQLDDRAYRGCGVVLSGAP